MLVGVLNKPVKFVINLNLSASFPQPPTSRLAKSIIRPIRYTERSELDRSSTSALAVHQAKADTVEI